MLKMHMLCMYMYLQGNMSPNDNIQLNAVESTADVSITHDIKLMLMIQRLCAMQAPPANLEQP